MLSYKKDKGGWEEIALSPEHTEFTLTGLKCGSSYVSHLTAQNRVGTGDPSVLINATTKGTGKFLLIYIHLDFKANARLSFSPAGAEGA